MSLLRNLTRHFLGTIQKSSTRHRNASRGLQIQASVPAGRFSAPLSPGTLIDWKLGVDEREGLRRGVIPRPTLLPGKRPVRNEEERQQGKWMPAAEAMKAWEMEMVKSRLRVVGKGAVDYSEFLRMCCECCCEEQGAVVARCLDESGAVMVHGNVVFLRPNQIAKAIECVIPLSMCPPDDPRREELRKLEEEKALIDRKAEAMARREMWSGLVYLSLQTLCFMRLTFWELSWEVMEPICFYFTSLYGMAAFVFFMRTSTDLSFEGFFRSRCAAKQRRLMETRRFDARRLNELRGRSSSALPREKFVI